MTMQKLMRISLARMHFDPPLILVVPRRPGDQRVAISPALPAMLQQYPRAFGGPLFPGEAGDSKRSRS